jgi:imidazolonepropionase-like amidohydrolase
VIVGGADALRVADELARRHVPVIVGSINRPPQRRWEAYSTPFENPAKLIAAGVDVAIAGTGTTFDAANVRNLPYEAAKAVAHGLSRDEALESVTLAPARILGIDARLGSLDVGKDATFIVTDGDPLDTMTDVRYAFIRGRMLDLTTRHTTLYEKYRERLRQLGFVSD